MTFAYIGTSKKVGQMLALYPERLVPISIPCRKRSPEVINGIAIQSTVGDLKRLRAERRLFIGRVQYVDYETAVVPTTNVFWPFVHKRVAFVHEAEVRAVIVDWLPFSSRPGPTSAEQMVRPEFEDGLYVDAKVEELVHQVYAAPTAPSWFVDAVRGCVERFGLDVEVQQSELGQPPEWDF